jgi:hypothetical protein
MRYSRTVWEIELSDEVEQWYVRLRVRDRAFADRALDRLAAFGPPSRCRTAECSAVACVSCASRAKEWRDV